MSFRFQVSSSKTHKAGLLENCREVVVLSIAKVSKSSKDPKMKGILLRPEGP